MIVYPWDTSGAAPDCDDFIERWCTWYILNVLIYRGTR